MRYLALLIVVFAFSAPVAAANVKNPKPVDVQGTVPVEVTNEVNLATDQSLEAVEPTLLPQDILILQSFIATTGAESKIVEIPKDIILRTITVVPSSVSSDPNLVNCGAAVRWPLDAPIDPSSTDRYIVSHRWKGLNQISLNYAMPYRLLLPMGTELETSVGRIGASGFCEALIILTGTTAP